MENNRSNAPYYITLICLAVVVGVAAGVLFFLFGNGGRTSYERAERNSFGALTGGFADILNTGDQSVDMNLTFSLGSDFTNIAGLPDIGAFTANMEVITQGMEAYVSAGLDVMGLSLSMAMWLFEEQMVMHFPELSGYYILLNEVIDIEQYLRETADSEKALKAFGEVMDKTLDRYFELTKDVEVSRSEEVSFGFISQTADVYEIVIDGHLLLDLTETFLRAVLDTPEFLEICEEMYDVFMTEYRWYLNERESIESIFNWALEELDNITDDERDEVFGTMKVYISGRDVIKREFDFSGDAEMILSFTNLKQGNDYVNKIEFSITEPGYLVLDFNFTDAGIKRGGTKSGAMSINLLVNGEMYSAVVNYDNVKTYPNDLFSGNIDITIPVPKVLSDMIMENTGFSFSEADVKVRINSNVSGNTQESQVLIIMLGMKIIDIDMTYIINTGKKIPANNANADNTLDGNDWRDMDRFGRDVEEAIFPMIMDSPLFGLLFGMSF
jgi:hypothetical protein